MIALDIFIGLVLIYFLYALLVSIIAEMISTWIGLRARILRQGIDNILNDKNPGVDDPKDFTNWIKDIFVVEPKEFKYTHAGRFYREPTIKYLAKAGENEIYSIRNTKPSYISKENFTRTILNMLGQKSMGINEWEKIKFAIQHNTLSLEPETLQLFTGWVLRSNDSYQLFINNVESTYAEMMDRVNGWYKRKIGLFIFWIGFGICMIMNVDSIEIVKTLADNPEKAQEMVRLAIATVDAEKNFFIDTTKKDSISHESIRLQKLKAQYDTTLNSIKKSQHIMANSWDYSKQKKKWWNNKATYVISQCWPWKLKFWGLAITALALSLGAQFWFDLLKKLIAIRGAGVKPEERPKDPTTPVQPVSSPINDGLALNTQDPVKIALAQNREHWESSPGYIAANEYYDEQNEKYIKLVFEEGTKPIGESEIEIVTGNSISKVKIKTVVGKKGKFGNNGLPIIGSLHQPSMNASGTPAGIVINPRTNRYSILTCGHVIRTDKSTFINPDKTAIQLKTTSSTQIIGHVKNLVMSRFCDAGIVEIIPNTIEIDKFYHIDNFRSVSHDEKNKTLIKIRTLRGEIPGKIIRTNENYSFEDRGTNDARYFDLLMLGDQNNNFSSPLTLEGDSGALIVDSDDIPIGILVGGSESSDGHFSYGIRINDIFEILQIQKYREL